MENLPIDIRGLYQHLAHDPKYQHFARIPDRIIQCIDYFGVGCAREVTRARLQAYYLFIGVVDDAIDSGRIDTGRLVLGYLSKAVPVFDEASQRSSVRLITEILKSHLCAETYLPMIDGLRELYNEVVSEPGATSIASYIEHRKSVGRLTAELSFVLIRPALSGEHERLLQFMKRVGAIGCLVDSLIDLSSDRRLGLQAGNQELCKTKPKHFERRIARIAQASRTVRIVPPGHCRQRARSIPGPTRPGAACF